MEIEPALYSFTGGADGWGPAASVIRDSAGNLYGTTECGGTGTTGLFCAANAGVVYKLDTTGKEAVLYSFNVGVDGGYLLAGLVRDSDGNLYGTTYLGGASNAGTVFKLDRTGNYTVLYTFTVPSGASKGEFMTKRGQYRRCPTASSNRLLNGALLGNRGTFSDVASLLQFNTF